MFCTSFTGIFLKIRVYPRVQEIDEFHQCFVWNKSEKRKMYVFVWISFENVKLSKEILNEGFIIQNGNLKNHCWFEAFGWKTLVTSVKNVRFKIHISRHKEYKNRDLNVAYLNTFWSTSKYGGKDFSKTSFLWAIIISSATSSGFNIFIKVWNFILGFLHKPVSTMKG